MPVAYLIFRGIVIVFAAGGLFMLMAGSLLGDSSGESAKPNVFNLSYKIGGIAVIISYLIPNRWAVTTVFFHIRLTAQTLAFARVAYLSVLMVLGAYGEKHILIYPVLGIALLVSSAAPILLIIRRRAHMLAKQSNEPTNASTVAS